MLRAILIATLHLATCQILIGQCEDQKSTTLIWDQATWIDGSLQSSYGYGTNNLSINIEGQDFYPGYPNQDDDFKDAAGDGYGQNALILSNQKAGTILISLEFDSPANEISFSLYDIDLTDIVKVQADSVDAILSAISSTPSFHLEGIHAKGNGTPSDNDQTGTIHVSIIKAKKIIIEISRKDGNIYAGLSDITACTEAPPDLSSCPTPFNLRLNWEDGTSGKEEALLEETYHFPEAPQVSAQISFHGDLDHFTQTQNNKPTPAISTRFSESDGGIGAGAPALNLRVDPPAYQTKSEITADIKFNLPIEHLRFSIYDIDNQTQTPIDSSDRIDQVTITGYMFGTKVYPVLESIHASPAWGRDRNVVTAHGLGELDAEDGHPRNTLNVYFDKPVDHLSIVYKEKGYEDPKRPTNYDPTTRVVAISPLDFCFVPQENEIAGQVFIDLDLDQNFDPSDIPLVDITVLGRKLDHPEKDAIYGKTDQEGHYSIFPFLGNSAEISFDATSLPGTLLPDAVKNYGNNGDIINFEYGIPGKTIHDIPIRGTQQIEGYTYADVQQDGVFTKGQDLLIEDLKIDLVGPNGYVMSVQTDSEGKFHFSELPTTTFNLEVDHKNPQGLQPGWQSTPDLTEVRLTPSNHKLAMPFLGPGMIGDQVYLDVNTNNRFDPEIDQPLAGMPVLLINENGDTVRQNTNKAGQYQMVNLPYGAYELMLDMGSVPQELVISYEADLELDGYILITLVEDKAERMDLDFALQAKKHEYEYEKIHASKQKIPQRQGDDSPLIIPGDAVGEATHASTNPQIMLYPNPVGSVLQFKSDLAPVRYKILNPWGQIMMQQEKPDQSYIYELDVSFLTAGVYYLRCETEEACITRRFVKN